MGKHMTNNFSQTLRAMADINDRSEKAKADAEANFRDHQRDRATAAKDFVGIIRDLAERGHGATMTMSSRKLWSPVELMRQQFQRAQTAGIFSEGGALVSSETFTLADALRPMSAALSAGAQVVNARADQTVPAIESTGAVAQWVSETGEVTETSVALGSLNLTPKRVGCLLKISKQLLLQAPEIAAATLRRDMLGAIAQAIDVGTFSGIGGEEPIGLCNNSEILAPVSFSGAPALADATDMEKAIGNAFAEQGDLTWVSSPTTRKKWRETESITGSGVPLWGNDGILGRRAIATATVTGNQLLLGNFADLLIVLFGEDFRLISDKFSSKKSHQYELYAESLIDLGPMRNNSFAKSTDSAAQ